MALVPGVVRQVRRRRRRSDPLYRKKKPKKKKEQEEAWKGPDDILLWEEFYDKSVRDPVTAAAFLAPLMFHDEKAALHKHTQSWLTEHLTKWPEHKELLQKFAEQYINIHLTQSPNPIHFEPKTKTISMAASGSALYLYNLGVAYQCGLYGYEKDISKAILYYSEAGKKGEQWASVNLGAIYLYGKDGVEKNEALGLGYLMKVSSDPACQLELGLYYQNVNVDMATEWYEKAISNGNQVIVVLVFSYSILMSHDVFMQAAKYYLGRLKQDDKEILRDFLLHSDNLPEDDQPVGGWPNAIAYCRRIVSEDLNMS